MNRGQAKMRKKFTVKKKSTAKPQRRHKYYKRYPGSTKSRTA